LGKRTWRHFGFVLVAGLGVVALSHPGGGLTLVGAFFALAAGAGWATYLFASQRLVYDQRTRGSGRGRQHLGDLVTGVHGVEYARRAGAPYVIGRLSLVALMALVLGFGPNSQRCGA